MPRNRKKADVTRVTTDSEAEETDRDDRNSENENCEEYAEHKEAVIIFVDVDSFEVQVRGRAVGFSSEVLQKHPFIVVNEYNVITAVNYPAKACGIIRSKECNLEEARKDCPNLTILKIPNHFGKPDSMETRRASDDIYECIVSSLQKQCEGRQMPIQRASKDEFFIDVSDEVFHRVYRKEMAVPSHQEVQALKQIKCLVETPGKRVSGDKMSYRTLQVLTNKSIALERHETEALLMHGASIARVLLEDIKQKLGIILSAGISSNKLLAKIGCGYNKPEAITVLPHTSLGRVSKHVKISNIPGLGGKKGQALESKLRLVTMSQLGHMDRVILQKVMKSEDALKYSQLAIGFDTTKVVGKKFSNKLTCGITFSYKTRRMTEVAHFEANMWNRFLEMRDIIIYECRRHGNYRIPKNVRLEILTRKRNLKTAFGETEEVDNTLRESIAAEASMTDEQISHFKRASPWTVLYERFQEQLEEKCKIDVAAHDQKVACEAIRKISEINLIATFFQADGDEE